MVSVWSSMIVMLMAFGNGARNVDDTQPCAKVQTPSSVVLLGSPVVATCLIRDSCSPVINQADHIEWRLDSRFLPGSVMNSTEGRVSKIVIPSFIHSTAFLSCWVQDKVVGGLEIRAGYPPETPQNLSCQTNLTTPNTLTCSWDPGHRETHLHTSYTIHTEIWDSEEIHTYEVQPGLHHYTIPRAGFVLFSQMQIYVKAVNQLGEVRSPPIVLEPVSAAKFDPPTIVKIHAVPKRHGCLNLSWNLSHQQTWIQIYPLNLELRLKTAESSQWIDQPITLSQIRPRKPVEKCHLLHGMEYVAQIRVRYEESPWSEWSRSQSGVTLESAPSGRLDWWMKVSEDHMHNQLNIHLFWKKSKFFRANGQNTSYVVSSQKLPGEKEKLCSTMGNHCAFTLPSKAKKVYLSAVNAAGKSNPAEVQILLTKAYAPVCNMSAIPQDGTSLLVRWKSAVSFRIKEFVVEWRSLLNTNVSSIQFETADRNQTSLLIKGGFEPYIPYEISVYPRLKDGIGLPQTVTAYSRQKAPTHESPKIFNEKDPMNVAVMMIGAASVVGLTLTVIIVIVLCFSNHKWLKVHLWPVVPDPANSSIKRWTSESTQDTYLSSESEEPNPMYLSHLSFLDIPIKLSKEEDNVWLSSGEDTSDHGDSPFIPGSNSDSVPYATVIFSSPCTSPTSTKPHLYLRSESTQPLLETEESFSPKCYQNMGTDEMYKEQRFFGPCNDCVEDEMDPVIPWDDFPFLRALAMNDIQNE